MRLAQYQQVAIPACVLCLAEISAGQPSSFFANVAIESNNSSLIPQSRLSLLTPDFYGGIEVFPGVEITAPVLNPNYAAPFRLSISHVTNGQIRTTTVRYASTSSSGMFFPAAANSLPAFPGGTYSVLFRVTFGDSQWDLTPCVNTAVALDDGVVLFSGTHTNNNGLGSFASGFIGAGNPGLPNFASFGNGVMDAFEFRSTYSIVPCPSGTTMLLGGCVSTRRRRGSHRHCGK